MAFQVGQKAPDFNIEGVFNSQFNHYRLSDFQGKWVVLFFYPLDFTFVCPTEILAFSDAIEKFKALNTEVLGVSIDSKFSHLAWLNSPRKEGGVADLQYPLLADLNKTVSADYGVLLPGGVALRGLFLIDPEGTVQYQVVHNLSVGRSVDETLRIIEAFQYTLATGEVCPANWHKGDVTMKPDQAGLKEFFKDK